MNEIKRDQIELAAIKEQSGIDLRMYCMEIAKEYSEATTVNELINDADLIHSFIT